MRLPRRLVLGGGIALASARAGAAEMLTFATLYKSFGVRGLEFSDRVRTLTGQKVGITGFMAPPLKPESRFFVLSGEPLAICPFCETDADWPLDIVVVYLDRVMPLISAGTRITVSGRLETGTWVDPETGFVSLLRLVEAGYARA